VGTDIVTRNYVNIGVAVALTDGLIVPVLKFANKKELGAISTEIKALAEKARNNELGTDEITGGTFTITNIGMFGMESFTPIINQPEVAILGVNSIMDTPMVVDGQVVIKPMMNLSLTADHRVVDGSVAAQFVARLKELIEKPGLLLL
jgi:pyruvate dehydrogenase E2 component (dihydrolipoamide acetyltransferase)